MFIYSVRAGTIKFFGVICIALVALITLIAFVPSADTVADDAFASESVSQKEIKYEKVKSEADAAAFLSQFGWEVDATPLEVREVVIPTEFDRVFQKYNEIQKRQGLDMTKYRKRTVTRYTFSVKNYPEYEGKVWANVLVYKGKVIGGDICSADVSGFVHGFEKKTEG